MNGKADELDLSRLPKIRRKYSQGLGGPIRAS
ncbi:hypothetical protein Goshw_002048 [Gossypium schwendimanii]|uniref:Uncharacterized protein n=1 Tax=Gossypium schwendimanii TaxID=34291 RepID=A0A7J9LJR2_GOSSC|nr:hypothetical protein [Gossypium schwendimanii]